MALRNTSHPGKRAAAAFSALLAAQNTKRYNNIIARLFRGELSLTITFWICFISLPVLGVTVFSRFIFPYLDVHTTTGTTVLALWGSLSLIYAAVVCTGLWRSREHYHGKPLWSKLAQYAAIMGILLALMYAVMLYGSWLILMSA